MKTTVVVASLCAALGGCANLYSYEKPGADGEKLQADLQACHKQLDPQAFTGDQARDEFDKCMAAKGYEKIVKEYRP